MFGNLTQARSYTTATSGGTRGVIMGGFTPPYTNTIDSINIAIINSNATDFGDLVTPTYAGGALSNGYRGIYGAGNVPPNNRVDTINYIAIGTVGNAIDFGEVTQARRQLGSASDGSRGTWGGGTLDPPKYDTIDYIAISTLCNGLDFGDLSQARVTIDATSGA